MDPNRLTQKSQEALHDAQTKALRFGHTDVDGEHLLEALLDQPEGLAPRLLEAAGGDTSRLRADLEAELAPAEGQRPGCGTRAVEQMRADAHEAALKLAAANLVLPWSLGWHGLARIVCGDLDGGDAFLQDAISAGELAPEIRALALSERSLVAIARNQWSQAEALATQAATALRHAGIEDSHATALTCAVRARIEMHRGEVPAARLDLVNAQRLRHLLTYASPCWAMQARIEMTRAYLVLSDAAGARTLMREIDEILKRRPGLGTLAGEAETLRTQVAKAHGPSTPGASALTAAELRLLPLLSTHLTAAEIAAELFLSPHTVKAEVKSIYRKLDASSRHQAITRARELGLLEE